MSEKCKAYDNCRHEADELKGEKDMEIQKTKLSASVTVEAAFVMPVIILCMVAMIWICLYFYNSIRAMSDADGAVFAIEKTLNLLNASEENVEKDISSDLNRYMAASMNSAVLSKKGNNITVKINVEMKLPKKGLFGALFNRIRNIEVIRSIKLNDRSETQRLLRAAGETVSAIRGYFKSD